MSQAIKERFYKGVKKHNLRMTKPRKAMVEVLDNKHLTFKEILKGMQDRGYLNVQTVYNTLYFLLDQKVVCESFFNDLKYYELSLTNQNHDANSHIHLIDTVDEGISIKEIYAPEIFEFIKNYDELRKFDIDSIKIVIEGKEK
ncbi:transcriptional repressor [Acholeplasma sp. OttesenSCG-928-E16]|nr:transcriptional repressor [Acholeplasma sp. OttesenSCG-928-E16]